jgi:hypothetical protein
MALKRYYPSKDTSIANYDPAVGTLDLSASNVGSSEILNLYFAVENDARANILVDFEDAIVLPDPSASVILKMFDAQHDQTIPAGYDVIIQEIDQSWEEGNGQDLDYYLDTGFANWAYASESYPWVNPGAVPIAGASSTFRFHSGHEDLEVDITTIATGSLVVSKGFVLYTDPATTGTDLYIKKFHSRHTHFPKKRPYLEVRWNDSTAVTSSIDKFKCLSGVWSGSYVDVPKNGGSFITGSLSGTVETVPNVNLDPTGTLIFKMPNLKPEYEITEAPTLRVDITPKDWEVAVVPSVSPKHALTNLYYRVVDDVSGEVLVPFGTGSVAYTKLSYDDNGNFFRFDMNNLAPGYVYSVDFWNSGSSTLSKSKEFKFRVR